MHIFCFETCIEIVERFAEEMWEQEEGRALIESL